MKDDTAQGEWKIHVEPMPGGGWEWTAAEPTFAGIRAMGQRGSKAAAIEFAKKWIDLWVGGAETIPYTPGSGD